MTIDQDTDLVKRRRASRAEWQRKAACQGVDPGVFFPQRADGALNPFEYKKATARWRQYCPQCPVRQQCLEAATEYKEVGIWAGFLFSIHGTEWKVSSDKKPPGRKPTPKKEFPHNCTARSGEIHVIADKTNLTNDNRCKKCWSITSRRYRERRKRERDQFDSEARVSQPDQRLPVVREGLPAQEGEEVSTGAGLVAVGW
jgi:hypothetical protein